ncbi:uncharacterized protein LOC129260048 [Lytechinus pictus]|uniref:uncharacterized protein LOC129260048 n=1 Tax=Lytechinus pictus TaxID=7653 RepID=UPI0030B9DAFE
MDRQRRKRKNYLEPQSDAQLPAATRWRMNRRRARLAPAALAAADEVNAPPDDDSTDDMEFEGNHPHAFVPRPLQYDVRFDSDQNAADDESEMATGEDDEVEARPNNCDISTAGGVMLTSSAAAIDRRARQARLTTCRLTPNSVSDSELIGSETFEESDASDDVPVSANDNSSLVSIASGASCDDISANSSSLGSIASDINDDPHGDEPDDPQGDDPDDPEGDDPDDPHGDEPDDPHGDEPDDPQGDDPEGDDPHGDEPDDPQGNDQDDPQRQDPDEEDDQDIFDEGLNSPLFHGSGTSKAEALLIILSFAMKNCLSATALRNLLELLNTIIGSCIFKPTKSILQQLFCNNAIQLSFHFYCLICSSYVRSFASVSDENVACPNCDQQCIVSDLSQGNFFVTANLSSQIKQLFERKDISPHLFYRDRRTKQTEGNIEDIFDGTMYKKMMEEGEPLSNRNNFSYTFNSDGLPAFKSSKYSIWPIYIMVNELPPKLRFNNLILAGVWVGKVDPKMEVFLKQFTLEANKLADEGVFWKLGDNVIHSKLFGLCCCADAPARAAMQNRIKFNGYSGCGLCYHPGKTVDRVVKYPFDVCDYSDRTDNEMLEDMVQAGTEGRTVRGVKGPSALINLSHFPICWGFAPDFMHCLLLGVARQLVELWLSSPAVSEWYIGTPRVIALLDKRLKSLRPPSIIVRAPRRISERKFWKASEWYAWLLFYSVPCLKGVLPLQYWQHLVVLVEASFILLQKSISIDDINKCDILLFSFVCRCQLLYGAAAMTFNVHSLTHLAKGVYHWGPLWTHSCFPFEAANWRVKRQLHGTRGVLMQVITKFLTIHTLPFFIDSHNISHRVKTFAGNMLNIQIRGTGEEPNVQALGCGRSKFCTEEERMALSAAGYIIEENEPIISFKRIKKDGVLFYTASYRAQTMTRDNRFILVSNDRVCELQDILYLNDQYVFLVNLLVLEEDASLKDDTTDTKLSHVLLCTGQSELPMAISAAEAFGNCLSMKFDDVHYIAVFPNHVSIN